MTDKEETVSQLAPGTVIEGPGTANELAAPDSARSMIAHIRSTAFQQQIAAALPEGIRSERFVRAAVTALLQNPELPDKATANSIFQSLIRCAQDGLMPDGNEAALVIFKGEAQYLPMIGGFRKIAGEYGWSIRTAVVYENDEFDYSLGGVATVTHNPPRLGADRGQPIGAYAVATHRDGRQEVEVMDAKAIAKVRAVSRTAERGPWKDWTDRMWEKTPGRRLFKKLPLDPGDRRIASMVAADEAVASLEMIYGPKGEEIKVIEMTPLAQDGTRPDETSPEPDDARELVGETDAGEQGPAGTDAAPAPTPSDPPPPLPDDPEPEQLNLDPDALTDEERAEVTAFGSATPPFGTYQTKTIKSIFALGEAADPALAWMLRSCGPQDAEFHRLLVLACRVHRPELYETWRAEQ